MPYEDEKKPSYMRTAWGTPEKKEDETAARNEFVTLPTEEELAVDKGYMNTPWQKPVGDVAEIAVATQSPQPTSVQVNDVNTDVNTDANTGTAALNNLFGDSWTLTPEQEQARLRRMHTSSMIGNLGNVMSAFANLYYAGKGAPSQKVPDAVVPDYMSFVDRVNQARRAALNDQYQRDKLQQQIDYQNESIALRKAQEQRLNESARLAWRKQDWLEKYQKGVLDIKVEQNRINEEYKKGQISIQEWRAANDELKAQAAMLNAKTNSAREGRLAGGYTQEETDDGLSKVVTRTYNTNQGGSSQKPSSVNASQQQKPKTNTSSNKQGGTGSNGRGSSNSHMSQFSIHKNNPKK